MILAIVLITGILTVVLFSISDVCDKPPIILCFVSFGICVISIVCGCLYGFIPHKPSNGVHVGVITAVDREGYFGNKYKIYLKSGGVTSNDKSDETIYYLYNNEEDKASKAKSMVGRQVKITYSFPGGYISAWSAGEYHIDNIELFKIEEEK